jgi:hypothetical protein
MPADRIRCAAHAPVQSVDVEFSRALVSVSHGLIRMCGGHATPVAAILRAPGGFLTRKDIKGVYAFLYTEVSSRRA